MKEQNMAYDLKLTNRRKPVFLCFAGIFMPKEKAAGRQQRFQYDRNRFRILFLFFC